MMAMNIPRLAFGPAAAARPGKWGETTAITCFRPRLHLFRGQPGQHAGKFTAAASSPGGNGAPKTESRKDPVPMAADGKASELWQELTNTAQLGKRGEAWFAAQVAALFIVVFPPAQLESLAPVLGVTLIGAGLLFMFLGQRDLDTNLTPLPAPREEHQLVTRGVYGMCRHPMYFGLLLGGSGLALASSDPGRLAALLVLYLVLDNKAKYEEGLLRERYGRQYDDYVADTAKFLPNRFDPDALKL